LPRGRCTFLATRQTEESSPHLPLERAFSAFAFSRSCTRLENLHLGLSSRPLFVAIGVLQGRAQANAICNRRSWWHRGRWSFRVLSLCRTWSNWPSCGRKSSRLPQAESPVSTAGVPPPPLALLSCSAECRTTDTAKRKKQQAGSTTSDYWVFRALQREDKWPGIRPSTPGGNPRSSFSVLLGRPRVADITAWPAG